MNDLVKVSIDQGWDEEEPTKLPIGTLSMALQKEKNIKFNQLTKKVEVDSIPIESSDLDLLYVSIEELGWTIGKTAVRDTYIRNAKRHQYHPIKKYLEFVEEESSTKEIDIDQLATNYLGTNKDLYNKMLKATLVGACKRIFEGGCQFDYVCTLRGEQGIRKSTFWKVLSGGFFNSSMPSGIDKDLLMLIGTCWFFALEELDSVTQNFMSGKLKNLITSREDCYRPPYGSSPDKFPRSSIFVATVNTDNFLVDASGSRRFWVVDCPQRYSLKGETIDIEKVKADRDGIWKASMKAFRSGVLPMLDIDSERESFIENNRFKDDHPFKYLALKEIQKFPCNTKFTSRAILELSKLREDNKATKEDYRQMGLVLRDLGCKKGIRENGSRTWYRPTDWSLENIQ